MKRDKILVAGSYNADLVAATKRLPKPGETVMGTSFSQGPGGKGSNQALAAARLGANVSFAGCVGDDSFGRDALNILQKERIDTSRVLISSESSTGTALIVVDKDGENQIVVSPGANFQFGPEHMERNSDLNTFGWMVLQLEIPFAAVKRAIELGKEMGVQIVLNPAPVFKEIRELLPMVDVITPNETEAELLTGVPVHSEKDAERAASIFLGWGAKNAIITMGSKGVYVASVQADMSYQGEWIPAFPVKAVDTTGAGDCFNGALTVALSEGKPLRKAVSFAAAAAALSVTKNGAGDSSPYRDELEHFLKQQTK